MVRQMLPNHLIWVRFLSLVQFSHIVQLDRTMVYDTVDWGSSPHMRTSNGHVAQRQSSDLLSRMSGFRNSPCPQKR